MGGNESTDLPEGSTDPGERLTTESFETPVPVEFGTCGDCCRMAAAGKP